MTTDRRRGDEEEEEVEENNRGEREIEQGISLEEGRTGYDWREEGIRYIAYDKRV